MRIQKNKNIDKKKVTITSIAILVVILAVGIYALQSGIFGTDNQTFENEVDYEKPTSEQQETGYDAKRNFVEERYGDSDKEIEQGVDIAISLSSVNQSNSTLQVRTVIDTVDIDGECLLKLVKQGQEVVENRANTQSMGSYTTCQGFDIPVGSIEKGEWTLNVEYVKSDGTKSTVSQKVDVK